MTKHFPNKGALGNSKYNTKKDGSGDPIFYTVGESKALSEWKAKYPNGVKDTETLVKTLVASMEANYTGIDVFVVSESAKYVILRCRICKKY